MPRKKTLSRYCTENFLCTSRDLGFCAAHVGKQSLRGHSRAETFDQIDDRDHRGREHYERTATNGIRRIRETYIDGAFFLRALQYRSPVASHDAACELALLERQPKRAPDQSGADDGDLTNRQERDESW
jgi:hypothetical protein